MAGDEEEIERLCEEARRLEQQVVNALLAFRVHVDPAALLHFYKDATGAVDMDAHELKRHIEFYRGILGDQHALRLYARHRRKGWGVRSDEVCPTCKGALTIAEQLRFSAKLNWWLDESSENREFFDQYVNGPRFGMHMYLPYVNDCDRCAANKAPRGLRGILRSILECPWADTPQGVALERLGGVLRSFFGNIYRK